MKKVALFVTFIASICLLCTKMNDDVYAAEQTNSQVGIKFIEGDSEDSSSTVTDSGSSGKTDNNLSSKLPETSGNLNYNLPQTGEVSQSKMRIGYLSLFLGSLIIYIIKRKEEKKMKKSKLVMASLATTLLFSASTALAGTPSEGITGSPDGKGATSYGYVKMTPGDSDNGSTKPIIPSEPGGETGNEGPLTIDNVSPLLFGENKIAGNSMVYTTKTKNPNVQVTDKRGGADGWNLQVKMSDFADKEDTKKILKGAELSLPAGTVTSGAGNVSNPPIAKAIVLSSKNGSNQSLMAAARNNGLGTWVDKFDESKSQLIVPAGNLAGEYTSTLTWTLLDAPN